MYRWPSMGAERFHLGHDAGAKMHSPEVSERQRPLHYFFMCTSPPGRPR